METYFFQDAAPKHPTVPATHRAASQLHGGCSYPSALPKGSRKRFPHFGPKTPPLSACVVGGVQTRMKAVTDPKGDVQASRQSSVNQLDLWVRQALCQAQGSCSSGFTLFGASDIQWHASHTKKRNSHFFSVFFFCFSLVQAICNTQLCSVGEIGT